MYYGNIHSGTGNKELNKNNEVSNLGKVVAIGGGHGLGRLLSSLSFLDQDLTGIVTTTDNGGSTGRLRSETGCIAWGDLRNCLSQLSAGTDIKSTLFNYRFDDAGSLSGHSLGNFMLLALDNMCVRPTDTLNLFREFLGVRANILPMSETPAHLSACNSKGCKIIGEVEIDAEDFLPTNIDITPQVSAPDEVINAINQADLVIMGPGSFLTSVMPPLLMPDVKQAIIKSTATKILVANMVPEDGPTGKMPLYKKMQWMETVVGTSIVDAIIWPHSRALYGPGDLNVILADLKSDEHERVHHKTKLVNTIHEVIAHLPRANSQQKTA